MSDKVELYDGEYGNYDSDVYRSVRIETYGEDFGQTSWVTTEESADIPGWLELTSDSNVVEVGCGSGVYALHIAEMLGCQVTGLDINALGIQNARQLALQGGLAQKVRFEVCDVSQGLPVADEKVNAVFANDMLCHIPDRRLMLAEMYRILKPGGRMLFSDALVIAGLIAHEEIATRSSIGFYIFSPPGENERLILDTGFSDIKVVDTTEHAAHIAARWRLARQKYKDRLVAVEGEQKWAGLQRFLSCVQKLTEERRLLRLLYQARKA